jgi:hypothetical protein
LIGETDRRSVISGQGRVFSVSAKHKRPFYVFAAVAAVCCMVLVTGVRGSKADDGQSPVIAGSQVTDPGHTLTPIPDALDSSSQDSDSGSPVGPDPSWEGDVDITTPSLDDTVTGADGDDPDSGLIVLPPLDLPPPTAVDPGDVTVPPVTDDADGKGRGDRGKKDKDKGKDKDEQGDEAEAEAESESEEEVDPDVYGLPEGEEGNEGDQSEEPVDPESTP